MLAFKRDALMKLHRIMAAAAVATTLATSSGAASAAVDYEFQAFSSFPVANGETFSGSFSATLPGFVTSDTPLPVASLASCTAISNLGPASCLDQALLVSFNPAYATVEFEVSSANTPDIGIFYYFDPSAFSAPGTYDTIVFGGDQAGELIVKSAGTVPEPGSWLLMAAGVAALASRRRRPGARSTAA